MKKIFECIKTAWKRICEKRREKAIKDVIDKAQNVFDVSVYNKELWLFCDNFLLCPMSMFENKDTSKVIEEIRKLNIEQNICKL